MKQFFFSCERNYKHNNSRIQMLLELSFLELNIKISQHLCEHFITTITIHKYTKFYDNTNHKTV